MKKQSSLTLALLLSLCVNAFGQTPSSRPTASQQDKSAEDEVVRITTNLVQVDVTVLDKKGRAVTDLRPEEIEILEDNRSQKITNFSYVPLDNTASSQPNVAPVDKNAPPVPPVRLRPEQVRRTIALVVDDLSLSFESAYYARQALKKFVDQQMQPGDLVAIVRTAGGMGALQQFTSDKRQLYSAIERVRFNMLGRNSVNPFGPIERDPFAQGESSTDKAGDAASAIRNANDDLNEFREELFAVGTLGALNYIVRGLRELPGRKSVMLISDGFKIFSSRDNDYKRNERILESLRRLTDLANRSSVVIYAIDARGLQTLGLTAEDDVSDKSLDEIESSLSDRRNDFFESQSGLIYLAQQTGGFAVRNSNDLSNGIKRVLDDQQGYYLIGYRPDESTFDPATGRRRFHKLKVKIKRPGLSARTRTGFFGITDEQAVPVRRTREDQMVGAITSPFNSSGVGLRLTSLFGNDPKAGSFVRSIMHINARDLTFADEPDGWHKATFDVLALTFGDNGVVIDQMGRTQTLRVRGETYERVLKNGFVYYMTVPIKKAGAYQLRAALRDTATEHVGAASQFIEVPDIKKNRLTISGVVLSGYDAAALQQSADAASQSEATAGDAARKTEDVASTVDPQSSPAIRRFHSRMFMQFGYVIYNAKLSPAPQLTTQMRLFRDGQLVFTGKVMPLDTSKQADLKRITAGGLLRLGTDMTPGEYVLQVIVTDTLVKDKYRTATQWMDFEIVK
jgi:VWFA-related protein